MNNNIYEILELCLLEIEQGVDVDTVLFRYPDFAEELRPILEASVKAITLPVPEPSAEVVRRNRARLLQRAAEMREARVKSSSRIWFASLRRVTVTLLVVVLLFVSGTGLVRAASTTIPGDNLYPVKRTWEDVLLLFTFNPQQRQQLEFDHENERLEELNELIAEGRVEKVDFAGYVTRQTETGTMTEWRVSGVTVILSDQTVLPNETVMIGAAVRIVGQSQSDRTVLADRIELLPVGSKLPEVPDDESESEQETHEEQNSQTEENSNSGSGNEAPQTEETETPEDESENVNSQNDGSNVEETETPKVESGVREESFKGVLDSFGSKTWVISGRQVSVSGAEINGIPVIGAIVKVEGYIRSDGVFVAKHLEVEKGSGSDGNTSGGGNDNSNDDDDHNDNDNKNDNSNSGSGGDD